MQDPIPAQANVRTADLVARADGSPITAGTVNFYVYTLTGANANKFFRTSDNSWQDAESIAGVMTHFADGHYYVSIDSECWIDGVLYAEYARETTVGGLHTPVSSLVRCRYEIGVASSGKVSGVVLVDECTLNADMVGTDGAALAASYTAARAAFLDELAAANLPADINTLLTRITAAVATAAALTTAQGNITDILADTNELQADNIPGLIAALNNVTAAAVATAVLEKVLATHEGVSGSLAEALSFVYQKAAGSLYLQALGIMRIKKLDTTTLGTWKNTDGEGTATHANVENSVRQ